jgi:hypothetical protein
MEPQYTKPELLALAVALSDLRDSLVKLSLVLKDHLADAPSPERDEVVMQVEWYLARIREGTRSF